MKFLRVFKNSVSSWKSWTWKVTGTALSFSVLLMISPAFIADEDGATVYSAAINSVAHAPAAPSMYGIALTPEDQEPSNVLIPTQPPISVDLPSVNEKENAEVDTTYVKGNVISNEPGGTRPVKLTVERQMIADDWMGDSMTIGPKEAALTNNMLRKDGGTVGVFNMPPANYADIADLHFTLTNRGAKMMSKSEFGLAINALYAQFVIPATTMKKMDTDMHLQLRTDHTAESPPGAQCKTMKITQASDDGAVYVTLPVENDSLSEQELQQLKVYAEYKDSKTGYVDATLTSYDSTHPHGMKFLFEKSGEYTIVLPQP